MQWHSQRGTQKVPDISNRFSVDNLMIGVQFADVLTRASTATATEKDITTKLIIESVNSISRDGPDMHIYVMHYKSQKSQSR